MKAPIAYALSYPERLPIANPALDLLSLGKLSFYPPDTAKFPCLRLAYEACRVGSTLPAVLNAANEVAVDAFLQGRIGFMDIARIIEEAMSRHTVASEVTLQAILQADSWARSLARQFAEGHRAAV
jgi:1-deoxy-D-xylulose-5-phosphate reductoisomerase